jgi:hypothetical protein
LNLHIVRYSSWYTLALVVASSTRGGYKLVSPTEQPVPPCGVPTNGEEVEVRDLRGWACFLFAKAR